MIGVKNNGTETLLARYNGEEFEFRPGGPAVAIPEDAARHIFGFGLEDKKKILQRLGWMRNLDAYPDALKRLSEFQFLAVEQRIEEPLKIPMKATAGKLADPEDGESRINVEIPQLIKK